MPESTAWAWRCRECHAKGEARSQAEATQHVFLHMELAGHQDLDLDSLEPDPLGVAWAALTVLAIVTVAGATLMACP